jgi:hypothetical protein
MAKNIEPRLILISEYLKLGKDTTFVIPEYQRGYSWTVTPHCDKMWQDIEAFIASGGSDPYFFGTIIVDCSEDSKYRLIDGQQRTITFLLLLKALLLRLNVAIEKIPQYDADSEALKAGLEGSRNKIMAILYHAEDDERPAMLKDFSSIKTFLNLENRSFNENHKNDVSSIIAAKDFDAAEKDVDRIPYKKNDNKYTNQFRNFKYFYERLRNEKEAPELNQFAKVFLNKCQIIEIRSWQIEQAITMFNSLNSTGMPLSDADIISAQLYSNAGANKVEFEERWNGMRESTKVLATHNIVDITEILTQFMYINRARHKEYFTSGKPDVTVPGLRRYYMVVKKGLLDKPLVLCDDLMKIARIWEVIKDFPIVKLLSKFNGNVKFYLMGYLSRFEIKEITKENVSDVCECLLRLFTILELVDTGYSSANFKTFLFEENLKLVDNKISAREITHDFNAHIRDNWEKEDIKTRISGYEKHSLVYLNEYIYMKNNGIGGDFDFAENVNVEHIMPASGKDKASIMESADIKDKVEFSNTVNKLGNKILLEEDINKSISDEWFKTKIQNYIKDKRGYKNSKYAIAQALTKYHKTTWDKNDIEEATNKAAERIVGFIFQQ